MRTATKDARTLQINSPTTPSSLGGARLFVTSIEFLLPLVMVVMLTKATERGLDHLGSTPDGYGTAVKTVDRKYITLQLNAKP